MKTISKEFWDDQQWGFRHHSELLENFKDQWVAIANKKVVSHGTNLDEVEKKAKKLTNKDEVPVMFVECGAHMY